MDAASRGAGRFVAIGYQFAFSPAHDRPEAGYRSWKIREAARPQTLLLRPRSSAYYARNSWAGRRRTARAAPCSTASPITRGPTTCTICFFSRPRAAAPAQAPRKYPRNCIGPTGSKTTTPPQRALPFRQERKCSFSVPTLSGGPPPRNSNTASRPAPSATTRMRIRMWLPWMETEKGQCMATPKPNRRKSCGTASPRRRVPCRPHAGSMPPLCRKSRAFRACRLPCLKSATSPAACLPSAPWTDPRNVSPM